jgi:hypothetical protein
VRCGANKIGLQNVQYVQSVQSPRFQRKDPITHNAYKLVPTNMTAVKLVLTNLGLLVSAH